MMNRRNFLKLLGLSAVAVPLAPLIAKALPTVARSDGTDVALTEEKLRSAFQQVWDSGQPTIIGAADVYVSDFGTFTVSPYTWSDNNLYRGKLPTWR